MRFPIKTFDRFATFPVVVALYFSIGYVSFSYPDVIAYLFLPFSMLSILTVLIFVWFGLGMRFGGQGGHVGYWLGRLWIGLFSLIFIAGLIQMVLSNFNPYVATLYITNESYWAAMRSLIHLTSVHYWGYFAALSCMALGLSYIAYVKNGVPCAHRLAAPLFSSFTYKKWSIWAKAFGESHLHMVFMIWFGLVLLSALLLLTSGMLNLLSLPTYLKLPIVSMSFFSFLFLFFASSFFKKSIERLSRYKISLLTVTMVLMASVMIILLCSSKGIQFMMIHHPELITLSECDCMIGRLKMFTEYRLQNLGWAIWMLTLPLMATFVTRISAGRSMIEMVIGIFSFAAVLQLFGYFYLSGLTTVNFMHQVPVQLILGASLTGFLFFVFYNKKNSWIFNNGFMKERSRKNEAGEDLYPVSEVSLYDGTKIRGLASVSRKWVTMGFGLLLIHTIGGWQALQLELTLVAFFLVTSYFTALVGIFIEWRKDGVLGMSVKKINSSISAPA